MKKKESLDHSCQTDKASNRQILEKKSSRTFMEIIKKNRQ